MKKSLFYSFLLGIFFIPNTLLAQTEPEDIATVSSEFQDNYYESLKQKGIENYDKAIISLEKCLALEPNNPVVFFELGKNYLAQKMYKDAYDNFEKVTKIDPKNRWAWVGMYDVCYDTQDYNQAIILVQKLVEFKSEYKEDLVSLYMKTAQFDKALELINELNETVGKSDKRELYKADILKDAKYQSVEKVDLLNKIKKNPKEESNYIALIYMYSQSNQEEKALEIAQKLEKEIPTSDWAQVSLFKFHLNNNDGEKAVKAMNIVLPSDKIDSKIKHRILNEFFIFTKKDVRIFNCFERPSEGRSLKYTPLTIIKLASNLSDEIDEFNNEEEFKAFSGKSFDNGTFWENSKYSNKFNFSNSAYEKLLGELKQALKDIISNNILPSNIARKMMVVSILIKYLEEREDEFGNKVFPSDFFSRCGANSSKFRYVLNSAGSYLK